jgi:hypothetical protein
VPVLPLVIAAEREIMWTYATAQLHVTRDWLPNATGQLHELGGCLRTILLPPGFMEYVRDNR